MGSKTPQRGCRSLLLEPRERRRRSFTALAGDCARERTATLVESPIDILLWEIPLNSHFAAPARADGQPIKCSAPPRSRAARHAAVDHELRAGHVAGRVGGEE